MGLWLWQHNNLTEDYAGCVSARKIHKGLSQSFNVDYFISIFTQFCKWAKTVTKQNQSKTPYMGEKRKKKSHSVSPGGGIPSQWRWPRDLLLFALVTAFCQDSVHNSGAHKQPRTVQRPGWSAWTKSKQITFPTVTDLQLTDRTACQRMTSEEHKDMSHPYLFLFISERVKSLSGRYFSQSRDIRPMSQGLFFPSNWYWTSFSSW